SYIGQAFAQIGIANPTNSTAPVVSGTDRTTQKGDDNKETVSTFIQNLFDILSQKETPQRNFTADSPTNAVKFALKNDGGDTESSAENAGESSEENNQAALAAYGATSNATTVGNIVSNLQTLVQQLNAESRNTESDNSSKLASLQNGFQSILNAQGANVDNTATLGGFLQTLAQNLEGQSPLGIIINTFG
ncbi:MAG: hypothetical protein PHC99_10480, partial [Methylococcales bacterium]|nr:hypothetical protein [Methylococcales bacterium]